MEIEKLNKTIGDMKKPTTFNYAKYEKAIDMIAELEDENKKLKFRIEDFRKDIIDTLHNTYIDKLKEGCE